MENKPRAGRNRTLTLTVEDHKRHERQIAKLCTQTNVEEIINKTIHNDLFDVIDFLPSHFVDLLFIDPPYNLTKQYSTRSFKQTSSENYCEWLESWFPKILRFLKPNASIYICSDWNSSTAIHLIAEKYLTIQNRITWEREKGRGAKSNWKNCTEDIWFCTNNQEYTFHVDAVKLKRKVIAPYKNDDGEPKDWTETDGGGFRLTHPSNIWTDITVPFWSMPENTDHSTQKPEKLLAKIILASSNPGDIILDPFLGSGTTSVVAKKLGRRYVGIEREKEYCLLAEKRLSLAEHDKAIQGYSEGVFWERNSLNQSQTPKNSNTTNNSLFDMESNDEE